MDFNAPGVDKSTVSIKSAILRVYIGTANSATLTIGYSYQTAYANRKALLASITGVSMGTKTGSKTIDITSIVQAYCRDGQTGKFYLWGYGTGGSSSNSNLRQGTRTVSISFSMLSAATPYRSPSATQ